ncbi:MAG: DNA polymerase IV [Atopobiaceae bacterium]|nr:DNA polymerase IV [Atopobiaceae bacterium]MCI2173156.1 DNA polymerase IV [Atopobiaceae bacterium]MCI2208249.1 DNA polymerase IV [Atopobiaceae bacterium]
MTAYEALASSVPWEGPAIGLLDLDAFFASVEQLDHPAWRGRPLIVGAAAERRGVVSTASYEARRFGVHSAMSSARARELCPDAIWTEGHFARYREMSAKVMAIIGDETPYVEQVSVDEAFFDVTPGRFSRESPVTICARVQSRVAQLGVTCSIGLGTNKTVAKIASERDKPRGLTVVMPGTEDSFLSPLPVRAMSGIGAAAERGLHAMGVRTLGQLAAADPSDVAGVLGSMTPRMIARARGIENSEVRESACRREAKSVSNERTFVDDLTRQEDVRAAVRSLSIMVARRLRHDGLIGDLVTLKLKFDYAHTRTAQSQVGHATDDEDVIARKATELLGGIWSVGTPIRLIGIGVSGFEGSGSSDQLGLFEEDVDRSDLHEATDEVLRRFGDGAIGYGSEFRMRNRTTGGHPRSAGA